MPGHPWASPSISDRHGHLIDSGVANCSLRRERRLDNQPVGRVQPTG